MIDSTGGIKNKYIHEKENCTPELSRAGCWEVFKTVENHLRNQWHFTF